MEWGFANPRPDSGQKQEDRVRNAFLLIFSFRVSGYFYFMETEIWERGVSRGPCLQSPE